MNEGFDLQAYLSKGIEDFMRDLVRTTLVNPRESAYMLRFAAAAAVCSAKSVRCQKTCWRSCETTQK